MLLSVHAPTVLYVPQYPRVLMAIVVKKKKRRRQFTLCIPCSVANVQIRAAEFKCLGKNFCIPYLQLISTYRHTTLLCFCSSNFCFAYSKGECVQKCFQVVPRLEVLYVNRGGTKVSRIRIHGYSRSMTQPGAACFAKECGVSPGEIFRNTMRSCKREECPCQNSMRDGTRQ